MFSIKIPKCNSPRPLTKNDSLVAGSTLKLTSFCVSLVRRSSIFLAVTIFPSRPTNGDEFVPIVICSVGSSICSCGNGLILSLLHIVSPTDISARPATATMSPASASVISIRL